MQTKNYVLVGAATLLLSLCFLPTAEARPIASCSQDIVVGTGAACGGTRTLSCTGEFQCWVGTFCSVSGTGLLGCVGPAGAQCGPNVGGCDGYGGFYLPPHTPAFTYVYSCTATGYGTDVTVSC